VDGQLQLGTMYYSKCVLEREIMCKLCDLLLFFLHFCFFAFSAFTARGKNKQSFIINGNKFTEPVKAMKYMKKYLQMLHFIYKYCD